ncbi:hypothetical protein J6O86_07995, partial [bacterium]|nr:hypothetical protein [bacterium]
DCEFQSMKLSHEKIALSRDMERISDEYQNAMNKTKLIYDYYGTGTSDMSLTYGLLMTPSVYNDYYPRLLTDKSNRVVLSGVYASAAKAAGIPAEGYNGTPSSEVRNSFVEALRDLGVISASTAASIESVSYNNAIGLGATFSATVATQDITANDFMELVKQQCKDTTDYGVAGQFEWGGNGAYPNEKLLAMQNNDWNFRLSVGDGHDNCDNRVTTLNLYDLLKNDKDKQYTLALKTAEGATTPVGEAAFLQQWLVGTENSPSFLNWMVDQFSSIFGGVPENDLALQYAYNQVYDLIYPNENIQNYGSICIANSYYDKQDEEDMGEFTQKFSKDEYREFDDVDLRIIATKVDNNYGEDLSDLPRNTAIDYIGGTFTSCSSGSTSAWDGGGGRYQGLAINLSHITEIFMTAFVEYLNGIDTSQYSYEKGEYSKASLYKINEHGDDIFKIKAPTNVNDGTDNLLAGFYDALFNRICISGWTENENIESVEYMQELMKSGAVYISSINNDGNYYQSGYSTDTYIAEVADLEGVAQAEAKYNAAKAKIENKENTIDMKMKNLDTEISSLTTEYDAVKGIISKTVEKSFKRYDA